MPGTLFIAALLVIILVVGTALVLRILSRYPNRGVLNVSEFLRAGNPRRMMDALDRELEEAMRRSLPRREFLRQQRKSLHSALEFMRCMFHSTRVCIELANNELQRELIRRPGQEDGEEFIRSAQELQQAAIEFRTYCLVGMVRARVWLLLRTQWWLPLPPPRVSSLR